MAYKHVQKFGGSSLGSADRISNLVDRLDLKPKERSIIVVSAFAKVTDLLESSIRESLDGRDFETTLRQVLEIHKDVVEKLCPSNISLIKSIEDDTNRINQFLGVARTINFTSDPLYSFVIGHGEEWSGRVFNAILKERGIQSKYLNAREFLILEESMDTSRVNWEESRKKFDNLVEFTDSDYLVTTGFIAMNSSLRPTTLGRNGSDFSAAIIANLVDANSLCIWTDVDGIYSSDPRLVKDAFRIEKLSYEEALCMAHLGAKVIHPKTMLPLKDKGVPIEIRSALSKNSSGTKIHLESLGQSRAASVSILKELVEVTFSLRPGFKIELLLANVFGACRRLQISTKAISLDPEKSSLIAVFDKDEWKKFDDELGDNFNFHQSAKSISTRHGVCLLSLVGKDLPTRYETVSKFMRECESRDLLVQPFDTDGLHNSFLINESDSNQLIALLHSHLPSNSKTVAVGILGPGNVGSNLIRDINRIKSEFQNRFGQSISIFLVSDSKEMLFKDNIDLLEWREKRKSETKPADINEFLRLMSDLPYEHKIVFDCTASSTIGDFYQDFINNGIAIITANKNPLVSSHANLIQDNYNTDMLMYEATVGAALPIISTISNLRDSLDEITAIEGVFSGSLSFIFNSIFGPDRLSVSEAVKKAMDKGMTEPDPRDDLSGHDVARKVLILARTLGYNLQMSDVNIEALLTNRLAGLSKDEFINAIHELDLEFEGIINNARSNKQILSFVGSFSNESGLKCGVKSVDSNHIYKQLDGPDNVFIIESKRFNSNSLLIKGPGAGPHVTSQALISDLSRWAEKKIGSKLQIGKQIKKIYHNYQTIEKKAA